MLTIPGKTFLVGEYAVLVGGEALGIATNPQFSLEIKSPNEIIDYHAESAVGLFCKKNDLVFNRKIINPYGVGGFGQSTAEFIFAWFEKNKIDLSPQIIPEIFNDYIDLFYSDKLNNKRRFEICGKNSAINNSIIFKRFLMGRIFSICPLSCL